MNIERRSNLIKNGDFSSGKIGEMPTGWSKVLPRQVIAPSFSLVETKHGRRALMATGNGRDACFGYASRQLHLDAQQAYRLKVKFRCENLEDLNQHLVHGIFGPGFNNGIFSYEREGEQIVGENSFSTYDQPVDVEIRLYFRFSPNGKVWWEEIDLQKCDPIPPRPVQIACCWGWGDFKRWEQFLDTAGKSGADIALLPEFCNLLPENASDPPVPEPVDGPTGQFMATKAQQWGMYVCGTFARQEGDLVFNSAPLFDRQGKLVGIYDKNMLYDPELDLGVTPGVGLPVFQTDFGQVGIIICYDSWFPETARLLGYKGAELLLLPNAGYYRELMYARASDNSLVIAASSLNCPAGVWDSGGNQAGEDEIEETRFSPNNTILEYHQDPDKQMILVTVDLSQKPSPHYWGGPMLSAPGIRRARRTCRVPLENEIADEVKRWWR